MKINAFDFIKIILKFLIIISVITVFITLILFLRDDNLIKSIKNFVGSGIKIVYVSTNNEYSDEPIEILKKYDIEYKYIDSSNFSRIEAKRVERFLNTSHLNNIILIYNDEKILDAIIDYDDINELIKFFQKNGVIPKLLGKIDDIIPDAQKALDEDYALIHIPYQFTDGIDKQGEILKKICSKYGIKYYIVNAYLLSKVQQSKLNSLFQVSEVDDQIVILVKNKKIVGNIRGFNLEHSFIDEFYKSKFITTRDTQIKNIDVDKFYTIINNKSSEIFVIGKDDCKSCDDVLSMLNDLGIDYDFKINYINIKEMDSNESLRIQSLLSRLGYTEGFSVPFTTIIESNQLIDYVVGPSDSEYFYDKLKELGIIK